MGKTRRPNTRYSPEFKISVILDMRENGQSYHETVRKYWQTKTRAENRRLRARNEWLEAENAYLKKLDALVQAEEERNGRKPGRYPN